MDNVDQMWQEGFVKAANDAGIESPEEVAELMQVTRRLQLQATHPDEFNKAAEAVFEAHGIPKEALSPLAAGMIAGGKSLFRGGALKRMGTSALNSPALGRVLGKGIAGAGVLGAGVAGYKGIRSMFDGNYRARRQADKADRRATKAEAGMNDRQRLTDAQERQQVAGMTPEQRRAFQANKTRQSRDVEFNDAMAEYQHNQRLKTITGGASGDGKVQRWYPSSYGF